MARLLDRILTHRWQHWFADFVDSTTVPLDKLRQAFVPLLEKATPVIADSVAHWFYESNEQEYWDLRKDFPNLAPPLQFLWIEHGSIKSIHSDKFGVTKVPQELSGGMTAGSLISAADGVEDGWILECSTWTSDKNSDVILAPPYIFRLDLDREGKVKEQPSMSLLCGTHPVTKQFMSKMQSFNYPALLTICFMHCKNCSLVPRTNPAPLDKKYQRRHGRPLVKFREIVIEPMRQVLQREGKSDSVGLQKALHICRGHFATYGKEGKGKLFGKYEGTFWVPQHSRGSLEEGEVKQGYKVKLP